MPTILLVLAALTPCFSAAQPPPDNMANCYRPIDGGWQIHITSDPSAPRLKPGSAIGVAVSDPRTHRRPLYPPADRKLVWTADQIAKRPVTPFRPIVIASNEPRFLFDLEGRRHLAASRNARRSDRPDHRDLHSIGIPPRNAAYLTRPPTTSRT